MGLWDLQIATFIVYLHFTQCLKFFRNGFVIYFARFLLCTDTLILILDKQQSKKGFLIISWDQGAGKCRQNRIQDTLFKNNNSLTNVIPIIPLRPGWPTDLLPLPHTFLVFLLHKHTSFPAGWANITASFRPSLRGQRQSWLCSVGMRKAGNGSKKVDRMHSSESQSTEGVCKPIQKVIEDVACMHGMLLLLHQGAKQRGCKEDAMEFIMYDTKTKASQKHV